MLDLLPALIVYVDADLHYQFANAAHRRWTGRAGEGYLGEYLWDMMPTALRDVLEPIVQRALSGERVDAEFTLPDGFGRHSVRLMAAPDRDGTGAVCGIVMLATDMSSHFHLEQQLRRSQAMFHNAFHATAVGKALVDLEGRCTEVNAAFARMLGYTREEMQGMTFAALTHPADVDTDLDRFLAVKRGEIDSYDMEKRYIRRDGAVVDALLNVAVVRDDDGAPLFFVSQIMDITRTKAAEARLRESNARLMLAMDVLEGGIWQLDIGADTIDISVGLARVFGFEVEQPVPLEALTAIIHREDHDAASIKTLVRGEEDRATKLYRIAARDGGTRWIRDRRQLIRDEAGHPCRLLGLAVDVTEERANETRLQREAVTDPLTGLLNRRGFEAAAGKVLAGRGGEDRVALMLLDLDRFKPINDAFGHAAGDRVLREVARRISGQLRSTDVIARLGGDEFALLLPCADTKGAARAASRIVAALAVPYAADGVTVAATASIGVAMAEGEATLTSLLGRADAALYEAKRGGRGRWLLAA